MNNEHRLKHNTLHRTDNYKQRMATAWRNSQELVASASSSQQNVGDNYPLNGTGRGGDKLDVVDCPE